MPVRPLAAACRGPALRLPSHFHLWPRGRLCMLLVSSVIYKSTFTVCSSWSVFYFSIQVLVCQVNSCPVDSIVLVFPMRRSGFIPPGSIELSLSVFISLRLRSTESGLRALYSRNVFWGQGPQKVGRGSFFRCSLPPSTFLDLVQMRYWSFAS